MYLIDTTYFTGKYEIPDINESNTGASDILSQFIEIEVREFMKNLLGAELFVDFDSYMVNGILNTTAPERWLNLVNGTDYIDSNGNNKTWVGLIYKIGIYPKSLLTNYIWCFYFINQNRIDGNGNSNVIDSKNSTLGNPANQYFKIWNEFIDQIDFCDECEFVGLNQFIKDNLQTDYPTSNYVLAEYENRFL